MRGGTLVICPLIALLQWQSEILRFTKEGSLKVRDLMGSDKYACSVSPEDSQGGLGSTCGLPQVVVYHGTNREEVTEELSKVGRLSRIAEDRGCLDLRS